MELFGIGVGELLLIMVVALVVLGPERLPEVARQMGHWTAELRRLTRQVTVELQQTLDVNAPPPAPPPAAASAPATRRYCGQCGAPSAQEARYCISCGVPLDPGTSEKHSEA